MKVNSLNQRCCLSVRVRSWWTSVLCARPSSTGGTQRGYIHSGWQVIASGSTVKISAMGRLVSRGLLKLEHFEEALSKCKPQTQNLKHALWMKGLMRKISKTKVKPHTPLEGKHITRENETASPTLSLAHWGGLTASIMPNDTEKWP